MNKIMVICAWLVVAVLGPVQSSNSEPLLDSVAQSHVLTHVPDEAEFPIILKRDLEAHFSTLKEKIVTVEYELLRDIPTQSGAGYPKYYAWVKIYENESLLEEGVVRLSAIDKLNFKVTHYFSKSTIAQEPAKAFKIFPRVLEQKIRERAG